MSEQVDVVELSRTTYDPCLHRTETLKKRLGVSFAEAWRLLKQTNLTEINPCRFVSEGYQQELGL